MVLQLQRQQEHQCFWEHQACGSGAHLPMLASSDAASTTVTHVSSRASWGAGGKDRSEGEATQLISLYHLHSGAAPSDRHSLQAQHAQQAQLMRSTSSPCAAGPHPQTAAAQTSPPPAAARRCLHQCTRGGGQGSGKASISRVRACAVATACTDMHRCCRCICRLNIQHLKLNSLCARSPPVLSMTR